MTVTFTSSDPAVSELVTSAAVGGTVTVGPGTFQATASFRPRAAGTTTVTASAAGFLTTAAGVVGVTVTTPGITMQGLPVTVGSGLQLGGGTSVRALLQAANHGGVVMRIESSNPAVALVSPNATTPGTAFIEVPLSDGQTAAPYLVQGVEGAEGDVVITASAARFADGNGTANVIPAAIRIDGLATTATAGGASDDFTVQVGIPNSNGSNLGQVQSVRAGGTAVSATLTSSDPAVGELVTSTASGGTVTVTIGPATSAAPATFRPLAAGTTTVTASAPGVITTGEGTVTVTVNP